MDESYAQSIAELNAEWDETVRGGLPGVGIRTRACSLGRGACSLDPVNALLTQSEVIGMVNELSDPRDVVVCAAGSMPGDLHKLWRTRDPKGYHVEYGYSCMGYEVAGGLGVRLACPDRDVFVMVGDGSYLMMATELATAVQEGIKIITVLVQNHGFASIGSLSESLGSQRFGTKYRYRNPKTGRSGRRQAADRPGRQCRQFRARGDQGLDSRPSSPTRSRRPRQPTAPIVIYVETDPLIGAPDSESWWDVPVSATSTLDSTQQARTVYTTQHKATQKLCTVREDMCPRSPSAPRRTPGASGSPATRSSCPPTSFSVRWSRPATRDRARPVRLSAEGPGASCRTSSMPTA